MDYAQPAMAKRMYDDRASDYNNSFHPSFASYFVSYLDVQPGWHVLDLASGTGLVTFAAARLVGPHGSVTGIDVSDGMQAVADQELARLRKSEGGWDNVQFHNHDIAKLNSLEAIAGQQFDAITCCSALVLLDNTFQTMNSWVRYLKPGGKLAVDATHPRNFASGLALEAVYARLLIPPPYFRMWSQSEQDLKDLLRAAGLHVDDVHFQTQNHQSTKGYSIEEGEGIWSAMLDKEPARRLRDDDLRDHAKRLFLEEWKLLADESGHIKEVDGVFVAKATKTRKDLAVEPLMTGSCACGRVSWQSAAMPVAICNCFCVPCRKVSGSPFLTMAEFPAWALSFQPAYTTLKSVALTPHARRSFCDECGSTLTFQHFRNLDRLEVAMGSLDEDSLKTLTMDELLSHTKRKQWCWMQSKVGWFVPPDDGWEKVKTMSSHAAISVYSIT